MKALLILICIPFNLRNWDTILLQIMSIMQHFINGHHLSKQNLVDVAVKLFVKIMLISSALTHSSNVDQ